MNDIQLKEVVFNYVLENGTTVFGPLANELEISVKKIKELYEQIRMDKSFEEWTPEENEALIRCVTKLGKHWEKISRYIPGRTNSQCRTQYDKISQEKYNDLKDLKKRKHSVYDYSQLYNLFDIIGDINLPYGELSKISSTIDIPISTLSEWRQKILSGNYPETQDREQRGTAFSKEQEAEIVAIIRSHIPYGLTLVDIGLLAHQYRAGHLRELAFERLRFEDNDLTDEEIDLYLDEQEDYEYDLIAKHFYASYDWCKSLVRRYRLSLQTPHADRRGEIDREYVANYQIQVNEAIKQHGEKLVYNMDETSVPLYIAPRKIISEINSRRAVFHMPVCEKKSFTVMGAVRADGEKLIPWLIAKGKTEIVEQKFKGVVPDAFVFKHSPNGWVNEEIMLDYLRWINEISMGQECALILDVFAAHRSEEVKRLAEELNINLIFVPANGTSLYQPLDRCIYGPVKMILARFIHMEQISQRENFEISYGDAADNFDKTWNRISKHLIKKSFKAILSDNPTIQSLDNIE